MAKGDDWEPINSPLSNWPKIPLNDNLAISTINHMSTHMVPLVYKGRNGKESMVQIDLKQIDHLPNLANIVRECYYIECDILYMLIDAISGTLTLFVEDGDWIIRPELKECFTEKLNLKITVEFADPVDTERYKDLGYRQSVIPQWSIFSMNIFTDNPVRCVE